MAAKRHHLVPQFYLRRFAKDDLVEVISRDDFSKSFQTGTQNALVEKQFYTMESSTTGSDPWVEEELFAKEIERNASRAIERVIDQRMSGGLPGLRSAISFFVAFQFVRGQGTRQPMVEAHKASARMIATMMTPEGIKQRLGVLDGRDVSDEEAQGLVEFARSDKYQVDITHQNNLHIRFMAGAARWAEPIAAGSWHVLDFNEPLLLTGDEPVGLVGKSRRPGEAIGLLAASEVILPTDPCHAIVIGRRGSGDRFSRARGTPEMARLINEHIAFRCHRYIVRMPGTVPLDELRLPERAPMVSVEGNMIVSRFGLSKEEAERDMARRRADPRFRERKAPRK